MLLSELFQTEEWEEYIANSSPITVKRGAPANSKYQQILIQTTRDTGYNPSSYLTYYPGNTDILLVSNIQNWSAKQLYQILEVAEDIVKMLGASALVFTVNSSFSKEAGCKKLGYEKKVDNRNPHSGRNIRFFIKEI